MNTPILRVRSLRKSFDGIDVIRGVDLDVDAGETLAIIGPSGSGKSTLLRLVMFLEQGDEGSVEVAGECVWSTMEGAEKPWHQASIRAARRHLGMVFQQFNLFPHMTVIRNITAALEIVHGVPAADASGHATTLLELVGLVDKADAYPAQLSGGQKQRIAIARALAPRPQIMLFDEITSALDPELVAEVLEVLRKLAHEHGVTMILVTHEMEFAREIADRVLVMDVGEVIESGHPRDVFQNPTHPRTREFLARFLRTSSGSGRHEETRKRQTDDESAEGP